MSPRTVGLCAARGTQRIRGAWGGRPRPCRAPAHPRRREAEQAQFTAEQVRIVDVDLSKQYHRDLLYVGASRATDRLVVLEADRAV